MPCDHHPLDFVRALPDLEDLLVSTEVTLRRRAEYDVDGPRDPAGYHVDGGDSGGPVWVGDNAWDITSGRTIRVVRALDLHGIQLLKGGLNVTIKTW